MTVKQLAAELHTTVKALNEWIKENNLGGLLYERTAEGITDNLSDDGEWVLRDLHLSHTHPEIQSRIDGLIQALIEYRKENSKLRKHLEKRNDALREALNQQIQLKELLRAMSDENQG